MKVCGIPAKTLPPCDLEWGHEGDMHSNAGDGFYAREHDDRHHRRQEVLRKKRARAWTRAAAMEFIASLQPDLAASGHGLALAGSLLVRESSDHDLDVVIFPMDSSVDRQEAARFVLVAHGMRLEFDRAFVAEMWREKGSSDAKHVDVWLTADDRRVDVFWLK